MIFYLKKWVIIYSLEHEVLFIPRIQIEIPMSPKLLKIYWTNLFVGEKKQFLFCFVFDLYSAIA